MCFSRQVGVLRARSPSSSARSACRDKLAKVPWAGNEETEQTSDGPAHPGQLLLFPGEHEIREVINIT